jgi:hypothetical protein
MYRERTVKSEHKNEVQQKKEEDCDVYAEHVVDSR